MQILFLWFLLFPNRFLVHYTSTIHKFVFISIFAFRLMFRGATYADTMRYQRCVDLWRRALEIRVENDSILYSDTCFTAQALVRFMVDYNEKHVTSEETENANSQRFHDSVAIFLTLTNDIAGTALSCLKSFASLNRSHSFRC